MAWGEPPAESALVLKAATPELFKTTVPRLLLPSKKSTVPVGVPLLPLTVALNVTALPATAGLGEEMTVTVLAKLVDVTAIGDITGASSIKRAWTIASLPPAQLAVLMAVKVTFP